MNTTLNVTILGTASLFLLSGCDDDAPVESNLNAAPAVEVPGDVVPDAPQGKQVPLQIEFPPFVGDGTPKPVDVPHCLPGLKEAPRVLVPEGARLLSRGKKVTSSDDFPIIGELELVTDGDTKTDEGYFVELMSGLQWVQIDLETAAEINVVWIWHYHNLERAVHDVVVQVSNDAEFGSGVTTLFNNDYDGSAPFGRGRDRPYVETRFGKPIDGNGVRGRYLRLYSRGSTFEEANRYLEVEVYGTTE